MNILKIGLIILTGAGFGFGVDKLANVSIPANDESEIYSHMSEDYCHGEEDFLVHMLEELTDEDLVLVQDKIDELLVEYQITLDQLNDDYNVRYSFMNDLMVFYEENEIDFPSQGFHHDNDDENGFHGGMGMH